LTAAGLDCFAPVRGSEEIFSRNLGRVFYCIGMTADYARHPFETIESHTCFLARVLKEARFEHLVYLSSTRLYDTLDAEIAQEDMPLYLSPIQPRHIYDLSKALGENMCLTITDGRASVARLACVFGTVAGTPGFLSELLQRAARERQFLLPSATGFVRDYIHVDDVIHALKSIVDYGAPAIYNVASGENVSNAELAEIFNSCGWKISLRTRRKGSEHPAAKSPDYVLSGVFPDHHELL